MTQPKLGFKREDGTEFPEWEEKTIKEIAPLQRGFDLPEKERVNGEYPVVCSNGVVAYHNQYKCEGYAVITGRSGTIGNFTYLDKCRYWPHNTSLWVTDFCGNNPKFIYYFYHTIRIEQYSTRTGVPTLNRNNVHASRHYVPCLEEQQKIADFLSNIDEVIAQSEAEVQNLELQKKAAMQKIFSQEVRFRREDGTEYPEWEEKKIGDFCSVSTGQSNTQDKIDEGQYPFYVRSPIIEHSDKYLFDEEAVITVGDGVGTGKVFHYVNGKYNLHQRCYRMYDFLNVNARYFYYIFSEFFYKRIKSMSAKTSVDSVRMEMITDMSLSISCLEEQQKIVDFLSDYDDAISYAKQELDKWKELKKGLLQQMFV